MKFRLLLLTMTFLNPGQLLAAEATLKPGQWETTVRMQMAGMPQLTPELALDAAMARLTA